MKKATFIFLLLPALLLGASFSTFVDDTAYAQRGGGGGHGGGGGFRGGGGHGGGFRGGGGHWSGHGGGGHWGHGGGHGHGGHFSGGVFIGGPWFWDPFWYPFYPYYAYPYASSPTVIIERPPEEYMAPAPQAPQQGSYWYYCKDAKGYYPYVQRCPGGWMRVVPNPSPPADLDQSE